MCGWAFPDRVLRVLGDRRDPPARPLTLRGVGGAGVRFVCLAGDAADQTVVSARRPPARAGWLRSSVIRFALVRYSFCGVIATH